LAPAFGNCIGKGFQLERTRNRCKVQAHNEGIHCPDLESFKGPKKVYVGYVWGEAEGKKG